MGMTFKQGMKAMAREKPDPDTAEGMGMMSGKQMNRSMRKDYLRMNNAPRLRGNLLGAPKDLGPPKKKFIPYRKGGRQ